MNSNKTLLGEKSETKNPVMNVYINIYVPLSQIMK